MLLEKMVNPKNILDSPHQLPNKPLQGSKQPFSPVQYLISTHRQAFDAVMKLWGKKPLKVYGARMTESVLTILCHILKGNSQYFYSYEMLSAIILPFRRSNHSGKVSARARR